MTFTQYIQEKGYKYEEYVLNYLKTKKNEYDNVWFFKDTPEYIIAKTSLYDSYEIYSKYRNMDIGADLVGIKDDIVYFIQCKNYDNSICINDLKSFYFLLYEYDLKKGKVPFIKLVFNNHIIEPKSYQIEAVNILKDKNRSILSLPCGMGKTYTSYLIAKSYLNIIIIAPTRTLAEELLTNIDDYLENQYNPILISMDGSRDPLYIKSILKEKNVISSTYDSVDILNQIIDNLHNSIIIIGRRIFIF